MLTFEGEQFLGNEPILGKFFSFNKLAHKATTLDCQPAANEGIVVMVSGQLSIDDGNPMMYTEIFVLHKGGSVFPDDQTFPGGVIGTDNNEEFNFTFSLPLVLAANDELEILLINLNSSGGTATINKGYFSVTKLH